MFVGIVNLERLAEKARGEGEGAPPGPEYTGRAARARRTRVLGR